ncbi:MAG: transcriptional regulator [Propionibacteriaceae bacterium]|nr:transcriptional regulator [Propionibacteriaceae bacterium]
MKAPDDFDELVHSPVRLRICAALATATALEFTAIEDALGVSTSTLSKQLRLLADAGYVSLEKRKQVFGRPRTWVSLTRAGRRAFDAHVNALRRLLD